MPARRPPSWWTRTSTGMTTAPLRRGTSMSDWVNWASLGKVLAAGLVCGVGIVVFFALGLVGASSAVGGSTRSQVVGWTGAVLCFGVTILAIAAGLWVILTD